MMNAALPFLVLDLPGLRPVRTDAGGLRTIFRESGVVVFPGFFPEKELAAARTALDAHFGPLAAQSLAKAREREEARAFACDVIPWNPIAENHPVFCDLAAHPRLEEVTEAVLGPGWTAPGGLVMYSVGGGQGQAWHQDCPAENGDAFNLNRLIYTDDVAFEDGAIIVVPGSHRMGRIPPGGHQDAIAGEVAITPPAGTLVLLHGHVYHRVTPNLRHKPRVSTNFRAFPAGVAADVTCVGVYRNGSVNFCDQPKMHDGVPAVKV